MMFFDTCSDGKYEWLMIGLLVHLTSFMAKRKGWHSIKKYCLFMVAGKD